MATAWEYCQLFLYGTEKRYEEWYYGLGIRYCGADYVTLSILEGDDARSWEFNPWFKAIGLLGLGGWEMVSMEHPTYHVEGHPGHINFREATAFFKRPVESGRRIDQPELLLV